MPTTLDLKSTHTRTHTRTHTHTHLEEYEVNEFDDELWTIEPKQLIA